ncbi:MAG: DUF488 domain-containing protein [Bacteroidales bacterium]|jgi:uncharacterized protein (DUF488 family)|nr:DUF488 domain-containing protein [Bacteroidales bacterium]
MLEIYTIGVYNSTENVFFDKLTNNNVDLFLDIRQRRGVRGSQYKFVNSSYLQEKLAKLDIKYKHIIELAPTKEIRTAQKEEDIRSGNSKKTRKTLGNTFTRLYISDVLDKYNLDDLVQELHNLNVCRVVLFCVEESPYACHRSIVANRLNQKYNLTVKHL